MRGMIYRVFVFVGLDGGEWAASFFVGVGSGDAADQFQRGRRLSWLFDVALIGSGKGSVKWESVVAECTVTGLLLFLEQGAVASSWRAGSGIFGLVYEAGESRREGLGAWLAGC